MVYHPPWDNSWRNSKCLGPLRLITSDERMAMLVRTPFETLLYMIIGMAGIVGIIIHIGRLWEPWGQDWYTNSREQLDFTSWNSENLVLWTIIAILVLRYLSGMYERWSEHSKYTPLPKEQDTFFFQSQDDGSPPPGCDPKKGFRGVLFNKIRDNGPGARPGGWSLFPGVFIEAVLERSFGVVGQTFWSFFKSEMTTGWEYPITSALRIIGHYCCCNLCGCGGLPTRESLYSVALNTSMAAFIDGREDVEVNDDSTATGTRRLKNPSYGNVVGKSIILPYAEFATRKYNEIEWMLDHKKGEMIGVRASWTSVDGNDKSEYYGMRDEPELNTYPYIPNPDNSDAGWIDEEEQIHQMGLICIVCVAYQLHGTVHWWSNGAIRHLIPESEWPLVADSEAATQYMNYLATFSSPGASGWSAPQTAQILATNAAQGMPFHNYMPQEAIERSKFHQMGTNSKNRVIEILKEQKQGVNYPKTDAIIATTVMHTAEHYYIARDGHIFNTGNCVLLESDTSGLAGICMPIGFWSFKSLIRQHLDEARDPNGINNAIYEECKKIDEEFAYNYLAIGCTV